MVNSESIKSIESIKCGVV